ncbi:protein Wnt-10b-like [Liolophura sinensis]|uniref:protein Wnt-10b-like n=1 Tax=Liolophura sinensis TaxID=3198878 RepID=UPI003158C25A
MTVDLKMAWKMDSSVTSADQKQHDVKRICWRCGLERDSSNCPSSALVPQLRHQTCTKMIHPAHSAYWCFGERGTILHGNTCTSNSVTNSRRARDSCYPNLMCTFINVLILLMMPSFLHALANDILRLNIPTEPNLDPNTVCKTYPDLTSPQYDLCFEFPDVTASAIQGVQIAIHECQYQLRTHRWNCSSLEKKNKNPHSSPILRKGYRETAFAYAISAAGVTHQVSKACSLGKLQSCGCDVTVYGRAKNWEWGGCSHNLEFGETFAKKFLDLKEKAHDIHAKINLHNNKVGRMAVIENVRTKCKCHGMSGSCELKTCWKAAPDFREIGELLKKKFNMAFRKVDVSNEASVDSFIPDPEVDPTAFPTNLLYYEKSPNFCQNNPEYDSPGTVGRLCNKSSDGIDNCETLCCGRGYNTLRVRRTERCNCKFHWCCYVVCQTCTYNEWVTVCK